MAMAHRAPFDTYHPKYIVNDEPVVRLRQLVSGVRLDHQPDAAVRRYIDEAVTESVVLNLYEKIIDSVGEHVAESLLVELPDRVGKGIYAIVKPDKFGKKDRNGSLKHVVVSIQDKEQVAHNKTNGKWKHQGQPGQSMGKLGAKISKDILSRVVDQAAKKAEAEVHKVRWKMTYTDENGAPAEEIFESREEFVVALQELVEEGGVEDVKSFKEILVPTWVSVKPKVKVQLDDE
jgi:hypothetical protein